MSKKTQKKKRRSRGILKWIGLVMGTLILIGVTTSAILCVYAVHYIEDVIMPEVESSSTNLLSSSVDLSSTLYYYDSDTESYQTLQVLDATENRIWISYEDIPEQLIYATVAIEDKRFFEHNGVDWKRTGAAILYMLTGQTVQGGSTITQQLIKNLTQQNEVTVRRKVLEIFEALEFEKHNTKENILEWYLNEIYLGHGCYGIVTAAQKYFNKEVSELTLAQCASLISITNNPSLYDPYTQPENNLERRNLVLDQMYEQGYITEEERDEAQAEELGCTYGTSDTEDEETTTSDEYYSWYTDAVIEEVLEDLQEQYGYDSTTASQLLSTGGLSIYTCYDPDVQAAVDEVYTDVSLVDGYDSTDGQQLQSGITVVDNETGAVVALAGAIGEKVGNRIWSYATDTVRQPGSSIKPLAAYAQALEAGLILPNTIVEDSAFMELNGSAWPKNSHGGYSGDTDIMTAVAQSINTVAVKVLDMVGLQESYDFLTEEFQLSTIVDEYTSTSGKTYSDIGYSQLGLGGLTNGVSTLEMAAAYSTFPREGTYIEPYLYTVVLDAEGNIILASDTTDVSETCYTVEMSDGEVVSIEGNVAAGSQAILSESTCFYMTEMLEAVVTQGTGTNAAISGMHVAGKTGTTDDDYDRWFVGYTPYYTAAVWTGYDQATTIQSVSNPAVVLWRMVMERICEILSLSDQEFHSTLLASATQITYCTQTGNIAGSNCTSTNTAWFLAGDEPTTVCTGHKSDDDDEDEDEDEDAEDKGDANADADEGEDGDDEEEQTATPADDADSGDADDSEEPDDSDGESDVTSAHDANGANDTNDTGDSDPSDEEPEAEGDGAESQGTD